MIKRQILLVVILALGISFSTCSDSSTGSTYGGGGGGGGGGSGLTASPSLITVTAGQGATSTISGGRVPYSIQTPPDPYIASASISGTLLTVNGVYAGSTSVTVRDSSGAATVQVPITVTSTNPYP